MSKTGTRYCVVYIDGATKRERRNTTLYGSQIEATCEALDAIKYVNVAYPGASIEFRIEPVKR